MNTQFTFVDLFAGIGGFHRALASLGGHCVGFSEIAPDAIDSYCANFNRSKEDNLGDITKLKDLPRHDFMTAGVPCQSWSIAGKKLGFDDDRGQLWNDTMFLLNVSRPKAFIFENVKGLADPRNKKALDYILNRITEAGYHAKKFLLNAYDYGVPQTRVRIYIIGFKDEKYLQRLNIPLNCHNRVHLGDVLDLECEFQKPENETKSRWSLSCNDQGFNDYFLFNDLRNGHTTIHSWDITNTTERQKHICYCLLHNRRKSKYGILDGNALSLKHFQELDNTVKAEDLEELVDLQILKHVPYFYTICIDDLTSLPDDDKFLLSHNKNNVIMVDELKTNKDFKKRKIKIMDSLARLEKDGVVNCTEIRYDFKNAKISTGLNGINRIFLPTSKIYPTLVASDTNDYVSTIRIEAKTADEWKNEFMEKVYKPHNFRKITKSEACRIQGFPSDCILPESRARWMKLIGNSVAVPVIRTLAEAVIKTGVFNENDWDGKAMPKRNTGTRAVQLELFA